MIARPGLIAGPGDPSDRFGYWAARLTDAGSGDVLTPTSAKRYVQIIDVADLARWIVEAGAKQVTGVINAVGDSHTLDEFFATTASICDFRGDLVAVSDEWLLEHDVKYWAGPRSLPLWLPPEHTAFAQRSNAAFRTTGGVSRPLTDTIARTVKERTRGISRHRRSGLTRDEEETLLQTAAARERSASGRRLRLSRKATTSCRIEKVSGSLTLGDGGEPGERGLKLVGRRRAGAGNSLLISQLGPVVGVGDAGSRRVDWLKHPQPKVPWRLPTRICGSPRNAPALIELDYVILPDAAPCERHGEHLTDGSDSLPAGSLGQIIVPSQRGC